MRTALAVLCLLCLTHSAPLSYYPLPLPWLLPHLLPVRQQQAVPAECREQEELPTVTPLPPVVLTAEQQLLEVERKIPGIAEKFEMI